MEKCRGGRWGVTFQPSGRAGEGDPAGRAASRGASRALCPQLLPPGAGSRQNPESPPVAEAGGLALARDLWLGHWVSPSVAHSGMRTPPLMEKREALLPPELAPAQGFLPCAPASGRWARSRLSRSGGCPAWPYPRVGSVHCTRPPPAYAHGGTCAGLRLTRKEHAPTAPCLGHSEPAESLSLPPAGMQKTEIRRREQSRLWALTLWEQPRRHGNFSEREAFQPHV